MTLMDTIGDLSWVNANSDRSPQDVNLLLSWHNQDPPDQWELTRNDYTQSIQGNRNPFVDHPEYVNYINFYDVEYVTNNPYFSEYIEGSSDNKALEIFNNTGQTIDLTAGDYKIEVYSNGGTSASFTANLTGSLANGDVFVVANPSADPTILNVATQISGSINYNGNDAVALVKGTQIIDVIGQIGFDPGTEWGSGNVTTYDHTLRRKSSVGIGDSDGSDVFDPSVEWLGFDLDTFGGLGTHAVNAGPPTIGILAASPKIPTSEENLIINVSVTDDVSVGSVKIIYTIDGGSEQEITMSHTTGSNYTGSILKLSLWRWEPSRILDLRSRWRRCLQN